MGEDIMRLEEIHDCPKCHGKMVVIEMDKLGNTLFLLPREGKL